MRQILAGCYRVAHELMQYEFWSEAEIAFNSVLKLSLSMGEPFFLNDARLSRALCLRELGRVPEYQIAKRQVPAGTTILIRGEFWRVEDL